MRCGTYLNLLFSLAFCDATRAGKGGGHSLSLLPVKVEVRGALIVTASGGSILGPHRAPMTLPLGVASLLLGDSGSPSSLLGVL